jgi:tetratricopeptide (TPR) repeat protein
VYAPVQERPSELAQSSVGLSARERTSHLLDRVIFLTLLALIPLTAIPYGTVEEWWESLFESIIFALAALWIVEGLLGGRWFTREHRLLIPLLVLLIFVLVQTIPFGRAEVQGIGVWRTVSADPYETRLVAFRLLALILAAGMLLRYTSTRGRLHALVFVVIGVGLVSAVFGMARQTMQNDADGFILPHLMPGSGYGQFINRNHFALLMEMTLGLVMGLVLGRGIRRNRGLLIYLAAGMVLAAALVLSNSRGGIFGLLGQALFLILVAGSVRFAQERLESSSAVFAWLRHMGRSLIVRAVLGACLMIGIAYGIVWMGGDPLVQDLETLPGEVSAQDSDTHANERRIDYWRATWKLTKANALGGIGFGGYWIAIDRYYDASGNTTPQQAHNDYLELFASGGLIGVALAAWFVVALIRRSRDCLRSRSSFRRAACFGALAGLFGVAIHSIVDFGLHVTVNALVFTALIVIATVNLKEQKSQSREVSQRVAIWPPFLECSFSRRFVPAWIRPAVAVIGLIVCVMGIRTTGLAGLSRLSSHRVEKSDVFSDANQAISLAPADPVAHYVRATALLNNEQFPEAIDEFKRAIGLRSRDHVLWLSLGFAYDQNGDQQSALAAFSEAVRLAPFYAAPRRQLGNLLLRSGQRDQAFAELSRAAQSDPALWPTVIELAWDAYDGDVQPVEQAIQPETDKARLALARFLIKHDHASDALRLFRASEKVSEAERQEILAGLITAKRFTEAYQVWSGKDDVSSAIGLVQNPGFESKLVSDPNGFGWQFTSGTRTVALNQVYAALDSSTSPEVRSGTYSLRFDFSGASVPVTDLVSQIVLLEPNTRYQLQFSRRSQALISLGMPQIIVSDAGDGRILTKSEVFTRDSDWRESTIALTTAGSTKAVQIILGRQSADPIFGRLWLDDFRLKKM